MGSKFHSAGMRRAHLKLLTDVVMLLTALVAFGGGIALLGPHEGASRAALGFSRFTWAFLHCLSAQILVIGVGLHVALNWRGFVIRLRGGLSRDRRWRAGSELVLYAAFSLVTITGILLCVVFDSSAPLEGPLPLGHLSHLGRHVMGLHVLSGMVALPFTFHHFGHRSRLMVRGLYSWVRPTPEPRDRVARERFRCEGAARE